MRCVGAVDAGARSVREQYRECGCGESSAGAERSAGAMDARVLSAAACGYIYIYMREGALGVRVQQVYCVYGGADCPVLVVVSRPLFPFSPTLPVSTVSTDRRRLVSSAAIVSGLELKASPPLSLVQVAGAFAARFE